MYEEEGWLRMDWSGLKCRKGLGKHKRASATRLLGKCVVRWMSGLIWMKNRGHSC